MRSNSSTINKPLSEIFGVDKFWYSPGSFSLSFPFLRQFLIGSCGYHVFFTNLPDLVSFTCEIPSLLTILYLSRNLFIWLAEIATPIPVKVPNHERVIIPTFIPITFPSLLRRGPPLFPGLIGAVVALLMAPQSGEETRTLIKDKSIEIKDKTVSSLEDAYSKAEAAAADARAKADELSKVAKDRANEIKQRGQVVLEEQKARFDNVVDAAKAPIASKSAEEKPAAPKKAPAKKKSAK